MTGPSYYRLDFHEVQRALEEYDHIQWSLYDGEDSYLSASDKQERLERLSKVAETLVQEFKRAGGPIRQRDDTEAVQARVAQMLTDTQRLVNAYDLLVIENAELKQARVSGVLGNTEGNTP